MEPVDIRKAKAELSKLVRIAEQGEDVVIAREGIPVVKLTRFEKPKRPIRYGLLKGKIHIAGDFDAPLPDDVLAEFEDGPIFPPEN